MNKACKRKKPLFKNKGLKKSLVMSYSHMGTPTLPSALIRFTSEFGMGSGGTILLLSPDKNYYYLIYFNKNKLNNNNLAKSPIIDRASLNKSLAMSYSHMGTPTLPSALLHFTSEFGMGSGGSTALWSLNKTVTISKALVRNALYKYSFSYSIHSLCVMYINVPSYVSLIQPNYFFIYLKNT